MLKILCSYHYFKSTNLDRLYARFPEKPFVFADSGAFSAVTQGATIDIADYAAWLKKWGHWFSVVSNLDVIRDPTASQANLTILESMGLKPIPVFHTGSPLTELDRLAAQYPYIALGGMVGTSEQEALRWAATCMKRTAATGVQFHGFGQTRLKVIQSLPWFSVDSSSWGGGHRYGRINVWHNGRMYSFHRSDRRQVMRFADDIRSFGVDPKDIVDNFHASMATATNAGAWMLMEQDLRARHGDIHLRDGSNSTGLPVGPALYLAATGQTVLGRDLAGAPVHLVDRVTGGG